MPDRNYRKSMTDAEFEDWVRYRGFCNVDINDVILLRHARDLIDAARELEPYETAANHLIDKGDRIRSMSNEELASWIVSIHPSDCPFGADGEDCTKPISCDTCWLEWVNTPAGVSV